MIELMYTSSKFKQSWNTPSPIVLTDEGIEIDFKLHESKAALSIVVRFDGSWNDTSPKFEQYWNAFSSIVLTDEGLEIDFNPLQL